MRRIFDTLLLLLFFSSTLSLARSRSRLHCSRSARRTHNMRRVQYIQTFFTGSVVLTYGFWFYVCVFFFVSSFFRFLVSYTIFNENSSVVFFCSHLKHKQQQQWTEKNYFGPMKFVGLIDRVRVLLFSSCLAWFVVRFWLNFRIQMLNSM